ncbi:hypothetical protein RDI58_010691 [Solanum bulbocastanum]|uniref:Uncharacterized protein n=1 Tax=Solanum bulbocastanum TaxID=147425 RepID=A0AAN8TR07_SOLBU
MDFLTKFVPLKVEIQNPKIKKTVKDLIGVTIIGRDYLVIDDEFNASKVIEDVLLDVVGVDVGDSGKEGSSPILSIDFSDIGSGSGRGGSPPVVDTYFGDIDSIDGGEIQSPFKIGKSLTIDDASTF